MQRPSSAASAPAAVITLVQQDEDREYARLAGQQLVEFPAALLTVRHLVTIDLSKNQLTRFPGHLVAKQLCELESLHLTDNLLYTLEDILALSEAPRLRELDLRRNPLRLVGNRLYLLEALLSAPGCDENLLVQLGKHQEKKRDYAGQATVAARKLREGQRSENGLTMRYVSRLPRRHGFPMLQCLNNDSITDADIRAVEQERQRAIEYYDRKRRSHGATRSCKKQSHPISSTDPSSSRRFDGSHMTAQQMQRLQARGVTIPGKMTVQRVQIDVTSGSVVDEIEVQHDHSNTMPSHLDQDETESSHTSSDDGCSTIQDAKEEEQIRHRLFRPSSSRTLRGIDNSSLHPASAAVETHTITTTMHPSNTIDAPWSFPIRTFDELSSEDRQYIRHRSRQSVESNLQRDDHYFASSVFLDCVAQAERSRRLVLHSVDALCPPSQPSSLAKSIASQSASALPLPRDTARMVASTKAATASSTQSIATRRLRETLAAKCSKEADDRQYAEIERLGGTAIAGVSDRDMQAALSEYFASEHLMQTQRTTQVLASETRLHRVGASNTVDDDLNRDVENLLSQTKLRNAVDLTHAKLTAKQETRVLASLLESDARTIEQERAALEQALHRHRLERIANNQLNGSSSDREWMRQAAARNISPSPWQERNWRAKAAAKSTTKATAPPMPAAATLSLSASSESIAALQFHTIETVDQAARDSLIAVNSHDLLVRCAHIRQHAKHHMQALAQHRDRFLDGEAAWEAMRQDPTNLVRRQLRRRLQPDAQEIQIGATQLTYSSLFR